MRRPRALKKQVNLPIYKAALQQMRAGVRNARIMCLGDSYTCGGASDPTNTNTYAVAWPNQLATLLRAAGTNANCNSAFGFKQAIFNGSPFRNNEDPRISGTGATGASDVAHITQSIGGPIMQFPNAAGTFSITPSNPVDTIKVTYLIVANPSTHSQFTWNMNGGSNTSVDAYNATEGFGSFIGTATLGTNTANMTWVNSYVNFVGWEAYNSAVKEVTLLNCGWSGAKASDWIDTAHNYNCGFSLAYMLPDLTIICLGLNDLNTSVGADVYSTNMQSIITSAKNAGSDVLLISGGPWDPVGSSVSYATQQGYWSAMHQLGIVNNVPMLDMTIRWGDLTKATAYGFEASGSFSTNSHPSTSGQKDYALAIFNAIGRM